MGTSQSIQKINFEDMQSVIKNPEIYLLINTLSQGEQDCLIINTLPASNEEQLINKHLTNKTAKSIKIIIYGRNCNDEKVYTRYQQFISLGFYNTYIYTGGLFEWLILQDIYGFEDFPTTKKQLDFIKYKPRQLLNVTLLEY